MIFELELSGQGMMWDCKVLRNDEKGRADGECESFIGYEDNQ